MKKIFTLVLSFLCIFFVTSCSCSKRITLSDECYVNEGEGRLQDINYETLEEMMNDKKSFVVFVYEATCTSCAKFRPIATSYANDTNLIIYHLSVQDLSQNKDLKSNLHATPCIFIFESGKLKISFDAISEGSSNVFSDKDTWKSWIESKIKIK